MVRGSDETIDLMTTALLMPVPYLVHRRMRPDVMKWRAPLLVRGHECTRLPELVDRLRDAAVRV